MYNTIIIETLTHCLHTSLMCFENMIVDYLITISKYYIIFFHFILSLRIKRTKYCTNFRKWIYVSNLKKKYGSSYLCMTHDTKKVHVRVPFRRRTRNSHLRDFTIINENPQYYFSYTHTFAAINNSLVIIIIIIFSLRKVETDESICFGARRFATGQF